MSTSYPPDLIACVMQLRATEGALMERTQGHRAHALFLHIINHADPQLAQQLHASQRYKPWTIAPLQRRERRLRQGTGYQLRICFLQSELYAPFARTFIQGTPPPLQLGDASLVLQEITTSDQHPWAGLVSWHELIGQARPASTISLQFVTPTAFALSDDRHGRKRIGLFPDGTAVWSSLLRRWNHFAPAPMPQDLLDEVEIRPSEYALHTEMLQFSKSKQLGFVGTISYQIEASQTNLHLLAALADAAFYLGVGYKTTQGMGLVRRIVEER